ncbi:MAG: hypothetical protein HN742_10165 [Lentisphaerae bacterium]|jgi:tagaturonate epimerase|nr:hypothetical protein [Lentisphaerota bacterium]MBT4816896.1 hypothetical protein [Lentisphaerota bacterium]MBT5606455.1 hypothetical protein [Lentisphaerota bacterium]MBT7056035.1 hypothetical protein [Lentisphaerota bacterium]MBT7842227.1 hypothetical protein [Lentisphaerota bacterium]
MSTSCQGFTSLLNGLCQQVPELSGSSVYAASKQSVGGFDLLLTSSGRAKRLWAVAPNASALPDELEGTAYSSPSVAAKCCPLTHANALALREMLPWTAPRSLRNERTTFGCGDRLGRATPGHLQAVSRYNVSPVLAQQSIRELTLTGRTFEGVVDDVTFLVFQAGFTGGFGADGDHLKTLDDINTAVDAGMAMITLDLSEVMLAAAEKWSAQDVEEAFGQLPADVQQRISETYAGKTFAVESASVSLDDIEAKRCAVMYLEAMDFAGDVHDLLLKRRGDAFDLEISIDETEAPTLPGHHLFIIRELLYRNITVSSLAPRFIGEFQKAIDYIGDLEEFERQFAIHCAIAKAHGDYKVSIHSGSDKFSAYPIIGKHTNHRVHVKTAGTSWLEAIRAVAEASPALYRELHNKALASFEDALRYYHVTPDLNAVPELSSVPDDQLTAFMEHDGARQLVHVTYGGILSDAPLAERFFATLDEHEDVYYACLLKHFNRHLDALGLTPTA